VCPALSTFCEVGFSHFGAMHIEYRLRNYVEVVETYDCKQKNTAIHSCSFVVMDRERIHLTPLEAPRNSPARRLELPGWVWLW